MKFKYILVFIFFIIAKQLFSQQIVPIQTETKQGNSNEVNVPSPAVFTTGVTSDVDLYTGKASINTPVYTLSSRELSVPISLNYASNGTVLSGKNFILYNAHLFE